MPVDPGHEPGAVTTVALPIASAPHEEALPLPGFDEIFRAEAAYASRTVRYLGVHDGDVEDATQEVFVVVHRRLKEFQGGSPRAWVRQICVHVASNHRRSRRRRLEDPIDAHDVTAPAAQLEDMERRRLREKLLALLDELPPDQRSTFVLFEIEQLTMVETAEALGCPLQTAYSRLHAARAKIRAAMGVREP